MFKTPLKGWSRKSWDNTISEQTTDCLRKANNAGISPFALLPLQFRPRRTVCIINGFTDNIKYTKSQEQALVVSRHHCWETNNKNPIKLIYQLKWNILRGKKRNACLAFNAALHTQHKIIWKTLQSALFHYKEHSKEKHSSPPNKHNCIDKLNQTIWKQYKQVNMLRGSSKLWSHKEKSYQPNFFQSYMWEQGLRGHVLCCLTIYLDSWWEKKESRDAWHSGNKQTVKMLWKSPTSIALDQGRLSVCYNAIQLNGGGQDMFKAISVNN